MKKQIFILVLAIFASATAVFGQPKATNDASISPVPLQCPTNDPLNPIAGWSYDYKAVIAPTGGSAYWYATKSTTFTTAGKRVATEIPADGVAIASGATNYQTSAAAPTSPTTTTVTWTSAGLAGVDATHPLFMVVEYNGPTCSNNIKVMQIVPKIAFTVDITNINHTTAATLAYGAAEQQCFGLVQSAVYDAVAKAVTMDFGADTLYFEVIAANFTGTYQPSFQLSGLVAPQTADIDWGVVKGTYDQNLTTGGTGSPLAVGPTTVATDATNTSTGVSIYVRVIVHNKGYEGTSDENITLAVEAVDAQGNSDVLASTCVAPATGFEDTAMQTLKARPAVTPGTTMLPIQ